MTNDVLAFLCQYIGQARAPSIHLVTDQVTLGVFGYVRIMNGDDAAPGYRDQPERRADVLRDAIGFEARNTAMRLSPVTAAELLLTALQAGDTNASRIINAVGDLGLATYQDPRRLFDFIHHLRWWEKDMPETRLYMERLLEAVLSFRVLNGDRTHGKMIELIGEETLADDNVPQKLTTLVPLPTLYRVIEYLARNEGWIPPTP